MSSSRSDSSTAHHSEPSPTSRKRRAVDDLDGPTTKARKIENVGRNRERQASKSTENKNSTAESQAGRKRKQEGDTVSDTLSRESGVAGSHGGLRGRSVNSADNNEANAPRPHPGLAPSSTPSPASTPPVNGNSPYSDLPRELRQMILYRVLDSDEIAANRYPLQFPRLSTPAEREQAIRFRRLRQRRDALERVEEEWPQVNVLWECDAVWIYQEIWGELMDAEPEVFG
ncbi:hypothetical protein FKW77_009755 [Venturia effusa]|uniref:Uncharacterized protein n=1 Tax=Venturia effusa TaxID=50376 RepID=A0A517KXE5_9PEZI|nr:hypothetical protein FKW77_009755 [Venturia effusa]